MDKTYIFPHFFVSFICVCFLYFSACGGKTSTFEPMPKWIPSKASNSLFYYGVGGPSPKMEDARESARTELIKTIEVQIDAEVIRIAHAENEEVERQFIERSCTYATQKLPNVQIVDAYTGSEDNYALAQVRREIVAKLLEEAAQESQRDVLDRLQHGNQALEDSNVIIALREYSEALRQARTLPNHYNRAPDNPEALWTTEIERKINRVSEGIQIEAISGNNQTGEYGRALDLPLTVQVHYQEADRPIPLEDFSLQGAYMRGTGRLKNASGETGRSVRLSTDWEGKSTCWIEVISSISRENLIRFSVNIESLQVPLESKAVTFRYASHFSTWHTTDIPVVTLNGSADEQKFVEGDTTDIEIRAPQSCHIHLLAILADGHFGYQQSVTVNRAHQGNNWRILSKDSGWALRIDDVPVTAEQGIGLETLLVITTEKDCQPVGKNLTADGLLRQLNESVGPDNWRAGWVSYHVTPPDAHRKERWELQRALAMDLSGTIYSVNILSSRYLKDN